MSFISLVVIEYSDYLLLDGWIVIVLLKELIDFIQVVKFVFVKLFIVFTYPLDDFRVCVEFPYFTCDVDNLCYLFFAILLKACQFHWFEKVSSSSNWFSQFLCFQFHWFLFYLYYFLPSACFGFISHLFFFLKWEFEQLLWDFSAFLM